MEIIVYHSRHLVPVNNVINFICTACGQPKQKTNPETTSESFKVKYINGHEVKYDIKDGIWCFDCLSQAQI